MVSTVIDDIDREILRELQGNARLSNVELGRAVGLSPNAAGARVQRLMDQGVISGFHAAVDHAKLGRPIEATIDLWFGTNPDHEGFLAAVLDDDRVIECVHPTGPLDYRMRARVASPEDLDDLLSRLRNEGGIHQTDSRLILRRVPVR